MLCVSMCRLVKILLLLVALIPACHCQPKEEDEWIDPFDMLNFDPGSGQMRKKEADVKEPPKGTVATSAEDEQVSCEQPDASAPDDCQISSTGRKDSQLDSTVASGDNQPSSSEHPPPDKPPQFQQNPNLPKHKISSNNSAYKTILRKHVKMLLDKWKTQAYSEDSAVRMTMALSASDRNLLAEFAESGLGDLYDVDEVLGKMVVRVDPADSFSYPGSRLESYIGISLPTVIQTDHATQGCEKRCCAFVCKDRWSHGCEIPTWYRRQTGQTHQNFAKFLQQDMSGALRFFSWLNTSYEQGKKGAGTESYKLQTLKLKCDGVNEGTMDQDTGESFPKDGKVLAKTLSIYQKSRVILNVGGTQFETTRQTLSADPTSLLSVFVDPNKTVEPAEKGMVPVYFIDRDPKHFTEILNYLRNRSKYLVSVLPRERRYLRELLVEADYYRLEGFKNLITQRIQMLNEVL